MIHIDRLKQTENGSLKTVYQVREYENDIERLKGNAKLFREFDKKKEAEDFARNIITRSMSMMEICEKLNRHDYEIPFMGEIVLNGLFEECDYIELIGCGIRLELGLREAINQ